MNEHQQYRILVVDDDLILNDLFCAFLNSRGFETLSAYSLESAEHYLAEENSLDLILLDYQLGDGLGTDLLEKSHHQPGSMPPVIMISANEDSEFLEACFAKGIADYIIKPVNLSLLALKVRSLINSIRLQRLVAAQKIELEKFKSNTQREEAVAKFTYEYLVTRNSQTCKGIEQYLQSHSSFSGDIAISQVAPSGDLYFLLADATGHGLSAAITIMPLVTVFNSKVAKGFHLQQIVTEINRKLVNDTPADRFVAAIVVELNFTKSEMSVWNGGMPTAYWVDNGKILHRFASRNMALGILDEDMFDADVAIMDLPETGLLFMCSDGLIEQRNAAGEQLGRERLESLLTQSNSPVRDLQVALEQHAAGQLYDDDISICSLDPAAILADQSSQTIIDKTNQLHQSIPPFVWNLTMSGQKLAHADLPVMANQFLQYSGMDQKTCQKVFAIITELVVNSIDHGILGLSSDLKQSPEGFMQYFLSREKLLNNLTDEHSVELCLQWQDINGSKKLSISCRDTGPGYNYLEQGSGKNQYAGRGLLLVRNLSESVEIFAPGNFIRVIL